MGNATFDTLEFADSPRKAGMPQEQAEAVSRASQKAFSQMLDKNALATKNGICELRLEIQRIRADTIRWVVGANLALGAFLAAVLAWIK